VDLSEKSQDLIFNNDEFKALTALYPKKPEVSSSLNFFLEDRDFHNKIPDKIKSKLLKDERISEKYKSFFEELKKSGLINKDASVNTEGLNRGQQILLSSFNDFMIRALLFPEAFVAYTPNYEWVITHKTLGSKQIQVVLVDRLFYDGRNPADRSQLLDAIFTGVSREQNKENVQALSKDIHTALAHHGAKLQLQKHFPKLCSDLLNNLSLPHQEMLQILESYLNEEKFNTLLDIQNIEDPKKRDSARGNLKKIFNALQTGVDTIVTAKNNIQTTMGYPDLDNVETFLNCIFKSFISTPL
jgi:hypothetical protein